MTPPPPGTPPRTRSCGRLRLLLTLAATGILVSCADDGTGPGEQLFGRVGEVRVEVRTPLGGGLGRLDQVIAWTSVGPWWSTERISYLGRLGDETAARSNGNATALARAYATWIDLVNEEPSVSLFLEPGLLPELDPLCPSHQSRVSVSIRDHVQRDSISCQRRSKRSQLWRLKMSHPAGGDEPQIVAASRRLRVRLG